MPFYAGDPNRFPAWQTDPSQGTLFQLRYRYNYLLRLTLCVKNRVNRIET